MHFVHWYWSLCCHLCSYLHTLAVRTQFQANFYFVFFLFFCCYLWSFVVVVVCVFSRCAAICVQTRLDGLKWIFAPLAQSARFYCYTFVAIFVAFIIVVTMAHALVVAAIVIFILFVVVIVDIVFSLQKLPIILCKCILDAQPPTSATATCNCARAIQRLCNGAYE